MHPRLRDGVSIGTFTYKGSSEKHYFVENKNETEFEVSYHVYRELLHADGTHPLRISKTLLEQMKKDKILTTSRYVFDGIISRFVLIPLGRNIKRFRPVCRLINTMLPVLSAIIFALAVFFKQHCNYVPTSDLNSILYYLLIIFSLAVHECAHLASGISIGYTFSEMGLLLLGIFPVGAYVAHEEKKNVRRISQIQFSLAGIEANMLVAATCLQLSTTPSMLDTTFVAVANINILLAILNLLPASGLDGESALSALLGIDGIGKYTKLFIKNKFFRKKLFEAGIAGYSCIAVFAINLISSALVSLLLVCDVICVGLNVFR